MTKLSKISIAIFVLSFLVQIFVSNHMTIRSEELNQLQKKIESVQNEISGVNQSIYLSSSIVLMEEKAQQNGFSRMSGPVNSITNPTIARAF